MRREEIYDGWNYHQLPSGYLYHTGYSLHTLKIPVNEDKSGLSKAYSKISLYVFDSFHYFRLTSRCLCLKLEVPIILKSPSHKVGIIKTQILPISNVKKLNTMRRTSKWVKDKSPGMLRALHTPTRCLIGLLRELWADRAHWKDTFFMCLETCRGVTVCPSHSQFY